MTLAEKLKKEGRDLARLDIAKGLLWDGIDPRIVAKNTGLPLEQVLILQKKLSEIETLTEQDLN